MPQQEEEEEVRPNGPQELQVRRTTDLFPQNTMKYFCLPAENHQAFDVHLVAIRHCKWSFNFEFSDGQKSQLPHDGEAQEERIAQGARIKRIVIFYDMRDHVTGFHFFNN